MPFRLSANFYDKSFILITTELKELNTDNNGELTF